MSENFSGKVIDRPGPNKVLEMLQNNEADALVFFLDRLSRNLVHRGILREEITNLGIELISVNEGKSEPTPSNRFTDNIRGAVAEYELDIIKERTMRGRRAKTEGGKYIGQGVVMFGYDKVGLKRTSVLAVNEEEAQVVRDISRWYVFGDSKRPLRTVEILERLDGKVRSKTGKTSWTKQMVYTILKNEAYNGSHYALKRVNRGGKTVLRSKEEWCRSRYRRLSALRSSWQPDRSSGSTAPTQPPTALSTITSCSAGCAAIAVTRSMLVPPMLSAGNSCTTRAALVSASVP
jgi:DNA invertase Pin-like site-specific DNA recombinase